MTTCWARSHRSYLNGPIPTGLVLYATVLMFGYFASRCFGRMHGFAPAVEKNVSTNGEYFSFMWSTTVYLSGSSIFAIWSQPLVETSLLALLSTTPIEKTTSSALKGAPSDHFTPLLM